MKEDTLEGRLDALGTIEHFGPSTSAVPFPKGLRVLSVHQLLAMSIPLREMLLEPILPKQGLLMLHSKRGVGKTHVVLGIAYALASGGSFLRWKAARPTRVLIVD